MEQEEGGWWFQKISEEFEILFGAFSEMLETGEAGNRGGLAYRKR